jgi:hypothetical protein
MVLTETANAAVSATYSIAVNHHCTAERSIRSKRMGEVDPLQGEVKG